MERGRTKDRLGILSPRGLFDMARWKTHWRIEKYRDDEALERGKAYEVSEFEGNLMLNEGINEMWTLVAGGGGTAYNNANARTGVGDSSAAESATQTDLQAAVNKLYKGMDAGYPTFGTNQKITFRSTYGGSDANWAWNEFTADNGAAAGKNLNRKVQASGTKASGTTWILTLDITLS